MKLGKTFSMLASDVKDVVGVSYRLIGFGLHQKFGQGLELLQEVLNTEGATISTDAVSVMMFLEVYQTFTFGLCKIDYMEHKKPCITGAFKPEFRSSYGRNSQ